LPPGRLRAGPPDLMTRDGRWQWLTTGLTAARGLTAGRAQRRRGLGAAAAGARCRREAEAGGQTAGAGAGAGASGGRSCDGRWRASCTAGEGKTGRGGVAGVWEWASVALGS
jgi:hypothetical protein